ncbi:MAG: fibronectin type III domain-containing protein [Victivallaceae bacterium]|nr:fibronectin type III domain-containing protein [Victivallaceae bacterium]
MANYGVLWYAGNAGSYFNEFDLVLLANAKNYSDSAKIGPGAFVKNDGYNDAYAILFDKAETCHLTVGGNYLDDRKDPQNIYVSYGISQGGYDTENSVFCSISAVLFSQNGVMHLNSKSGARTANDSSNLSDDNIKIVAGGTFGRSVGLSFDPDTHQMSGFAIYDAQKDPEKNWPAENLNVAAIRAGKELVFSSAFSGVISVANAIVFKAYHKSYTDGEGVRRESAEYTRISGGTAVNEQVRPRLDLYRDDAVSNVFNTYGVCASDIKFESNQLASISAINGDSAIVAQADFTVKDNVLDATGICAAQTLEQKNVWGGSISIGSGVTSLIADGLNPVTTEFRDKAGNIYYHEIVSWCLPKSDNPDEDDPMEGFLVDEEAQSKYDNAAVQNNQIRFRAVAADTLTIGAIGKNYDTGFEESGFNSRADFEVNSGRVEFIARAQDRYIYVLDGKAGLVRDLKQTKYAVADVSGNTVSVAALQGDVISIDSVADAANASFTVNADDILFATELKSTQNNSFIRNNGAYVAAILGHTVSLGDFDGKIDVAAGTIAMLPDNPDAPGKIAGNTIAVAGIYAETLTVSRRLGGSIDVSVKYIDAGVSTEKDNPCVSTVDAIQATTLTVHGRIETDLKGGGITAGTLTADAVASNISDAHVAVSASGMLLGNSRCDALDVTGDISVTSTDAVVAYGILGGEFATDGKSAGTNLRVSGKLVYDKVKSSGGNGFAISTEFNKERALDDVIEIAAGGIVKGDIDLHAGDNYMILDSAASFSEGRVRAQGGNVKYAFVLNGEEEADERRKACYTVGNGDHLFLSTSSIGVNLDYALSDEKYALIDFTGSTDFDVSKWADRKVTFTWRGEEQSAVIGQNKGEIRDAFSDGTRAKVFFDGKVLSVQVSYGASKKDLATLDTSAVTEKFSAAQSNYTIDWTQAARSGSWKTAMTDLAYYELEYTVNGAASIILRLESKTTKAVINGIDATDKLKWRIRGVAIGSESSTYYKEMTAWSDWETSGRSSSDSRTIDVSTLATKVSSSFRGDTPINSPSAIFSWNPAEVSNTTVDHYVVEYYESPKVLSKKEAQSALDAKPTAVKSVRDTSLALSSLTNRTYIYWRVQAVDIYGKKSAFVMGDEFRVDTSDTKPPTFFNDKIGVSYTAAKGKDLSKINLTVSWDKASDDASGVKKYRIVLTQGEKVYVKEVLHENSKTSYSCTFDNLAAGKYSCSVIAYDYCLNSSEISTSGIYGAVPVDGVFTSITAKPEIEAEILYEYKKIGESDFYYDEELGRIVPNEPVPVASGYKNASATFTWSDDFTSECDVSYALEFSDKKDFSGKTAIYYVRDEEIKPEEESGEEPITVAAHTVTLDNDSTRPIGILANLSGGTDKNLYWRILVGNLDSQGEFAASKQSDTNSFKLVATDEEGQSVPISFCQKPAKPKITSVTQQQTDGCYNGKLDLVWESEKSGLGISSYVVKLTNKTDSSLNRSWTLDYNNVLVVAGNTIAQTVDLKSLYLGAKCDGNYSVTVTAKDSNGGSTASSAKSFTVDLTRPKKVSVTVGTYASDMRVSWSASSDASGIGKYYVCYRQVGDSPWGTQSASASTRQYSTPKLANGEYEVKVCAVDKNGNFSLDSNIETVEVNNSYDLCDTYSKSKWTLYSGDKFTVTDKIPQEKDTRKWTASVGASDKADYFYFTNDVSFGATFKVSQLAGVGSDKTGIKISLYKYDGTGKEKAIKTVSLAKAGTAFSNLSLEKGTYFVKVTSGTSTSINTYKLDVSKQQYGLVDDQGKFHPETNTTADDNWKKLDTSVYRSLSVKNSKLTDWLGFGDAIDYRMLDIPIAGNYQLTLKATSNPVSLTVYKKKSDGTLSSKKTISCSAGKTASLEILLEGKDAAQYYIAVKNANASKSKNTNYQVILKGVKIFQDKNGNPLGNNADDTWKKVKSVSYYAVKKGSSFSDWVGFGDSVDYRKLNMKYAGKYTFTLKNATAPVSLTIYRQKGSGSLEKMKTVSVSSGTARIKDLLLPTTDASGYTYYLSVTATKASSAKNTAYELSITGSEYSKGNTKDDTYKKADSNGYKLSYGGNVGDEWVGYGDTVDYRRIKLKYDGKYDFKIAGVTNAVTVTLWKYSNSKLNKVKSITVQKGSGTLKDQLLSKSGKYYISVSGNGASSGKNTDYTLKMTGEEFKYAYTGDDWSDLKTKGSSSQKIGKFGTLDSGDIGHTLKRTDSPCGAVSSKKNWVGYGDAVDYVKFSIGDAAKLAFTLKAFGDHDKTVLSLYKLQKSGSKYSLKELTAVSVAAKSSGKSASTKALQLAKGTYYIAVKSPDAAKGASSTYSVVLKSGSKFYDDPDNVNLDDTWQKAAANQDSHEISKGSSLGINDWVGFGNASDFWKIDLAKNGKLQIDFDDKSTWSAYKNKHIDLKLLDGNGNALELSLNSANQVVSKKSLSSNGNYYLGIGSTDTAKYDDNKYALQLCIKK